MLYYTYILNILFFKYLLNNSSMFIWTCITSLASSVPKQSPLLLVLDSGSASFGYATNISTTGNVKNSMGPVSTYQWGVNVFVSGSTNKGLVGCADNRLFLY